MNIIQKRNLVFGSIVSALAIAVIILAWQNRELRISRQRLLDEISAGHPEKGRKTDPYLANEVKNTIMKNAGEIQRCYNEFIAKNPAKTDGAIKADWRIDENGKTIKPQIVFSELNDAGLEQCVISCVSRWDFPPPVYPRYAAHTFTFRKKAGP